MTEQELLEIEARAHELRIVHVERLSGGSDRVTATIYSVPALIAEVRRLQEELEELRCSIPWTQTYD